MKFLKSRYKCLIVGLTPIATFVLSGIICTTFDIFHKVPPECIIKINVISAAMIIVSAILLWNIDKESES